MKNTFALLLSVVAVSRAAIIPFDLSPPGSDAAVGLSPTNEVPAVTTSAGSGGEVSGGIQFDTDTLKLTFAIGYGSAAGFTDLSASAAALHIHGPAPVGVPTNVLFGLGAYHFPAVDPSKGGIILGTIAYNAAQASDLLAGLHYINIHTTNHPSGEVRAQLIPVLASNTPPKLVCPPPAIVQCGDPVSLTANVSDADGDSLIVVWTLNGTDVQTNNVPGGSPSTSANVAFVAELPLGTNTIGIEVTDSSANTVACATTVTVIDTVPPVITEVVASPNILWPPNHKMVPVRLRAKVEDACGPTAWKIISVRSNESSDDLGDGSTARDWQITSDHSLQLRAERSGKGSGRIYTITVRARDAAGNISAPKTVTVTVPHDQGKNQEQDKGNQGKGKQGKG